MPAERLNMPWMSRSEEQRIRRPSGWKPLLFGCVVSSFAIPAAQAQTATWTGPAYGSWFDGNSWNPAGVPTAASDVVISGGLPVIAGPDLAEAATVTISGNTQVYASNANIGGLRTITIHGLGMSGVDSLTGLALFGASSLGGATLTLAGSGQSVYGDGVVRFTGTSTADGANLTVSNHSQFFFTQSSTAGNATITNNVDGLTAFSESSNAGTATITNNSGGVTVFASTGTGENATIHNNANGVVDISLTSSSSPQANGTTSIGSLSGSGNVYLGDSRLILGNLNRNDLISGVIADGMSPQMVHYFDYRGVPSATFPGAGALAKIGSGTLTLTGMNTYTGGTIISGGAVAIAADSAIGAPDGGLTFDGGALRLNSSFDLSASRAISITAAGGTLDTNTFASTIVQPISGEGGLTVAGGGMLTLTGANTYTGDTRIAADTRLQLGNGGNSGSLAGDVVNNGRLIFNRADGVVFSSAISGAGDVWQQGAGSTILSGNNVYSGSTVVNAGTLAAGRPNAFSVNSAHVVNSGGTLSLEGFSQGVAALQNAGNVFIGSDRQAVAPGTVLTVTGNYAGAGGTVHFNTVLDGDTSSTDRLVVNGDTSGTTQVRVSNAGGLGAQTINGIKLIEVGGASNGSFALQGDYVNNGEQAVVAGAYAYKLYKNGLATPADGDWYLRSQLQSGDSAASSTPLYQPGAPVYESYPQFLLGLNGLPTLQQRVGNRYWSDAGNARPQEAGGAIEGKGVWSRIEGTHTKVDPRYSTSSAQFDYDIFKMQVGLDGTLYESNAGKMIGGITGHYTRGTADTWSPHDTDQGGGKIRTDGYGFGGTLTWYGDNGFYLDAQGQVTWYSSDLSAAGGNDSLVKGNDGFGYAMSLESGKRVALAPNWSLTPQAQLVYSRVAFDRFNDAFDARVRLDRGDSLQGRLGMALDYQASRYSGPVMVDRVHAYGIANIYNEFLQGTRINVADTDFTSRTERLWAGVGIGGSYSWDDDKYAIYGEGSINTSLAAFGESYAYNGKIGARIRW